MKGRREMLRKGLGRTNRVPHQDGTQTQRDRVASRPPLVSGENLGYDETHPWFSLQQNRTAKARSMDKVVKRDSPAKREWSCSHNPKQEPLAILNGLKQRLGERSNIAKTISHWRSPKDSSVVTYGELVTRLGLMGFKTSEPEWQKLFTCNDTGKLASSRFEVPVKTLLDYADKAADKSFIEIVKSEATADKPLDYLRDRRLEIKQEGKQAFLQAKLSKHKARIVELISQEEARLAQAGKLLTIASLEKKLTHLGISSLTDKGDPDWKNALASEEGLPQSIWSLLHSSYVTKEGRFDKEKFKQDMSLPVTEVSDLGMIVLSRGTLKPAHLHQKHSSVDNAVSNKGSLFTPNRVEESFPRVQRRIRQAKILPGTFKSKQLWNFLEVVEKFEQAGIAKRDLEVLLTVKDGLVHSNELEQLLKEENPIQAIDRIQRRPRMYILPTGSLSNTAPETVDKNPNLGDITVTDNEESVQLHKRLLGRLIQTAQINHRGNFTLLKSFDVDKDGIVTKDDFAAAAKKLTGANTQVAADAYRLLDLSHKGYVDVNDLKKFNSDNNNSHIRTLPSKEAHQELKSVAEKVAKDRSDRSFRATNSVIQLLNAPERTTRTSAHPAYLLKDTFESTMARARSLECEGRAEAIGYPKNISELVNSRTEYQTEARQAAKRRIEAIGARMAQRLQPLPTKDSSFNQ